ncbi:MAG: hypothetical protein AB3N16_07865 [Flavobacteriaceae bacterium]
MKKVFIGLLAIAALSLGSCSKDDDDQTELYQIDKGDPPPKNGIEKGTPPPPNG